MQDWKKMIFNHDDIAPVSFVKLFKVDNEETRKLVLAKFTDDTTFAGIFYWDSDGEKIKLVRQGEYFGKKITTLIGGNIARAHFPTKKDKETIKNYLEEIASCYEVVYKNRETTVSIPVLYFKAGYIIDPVLSTSQFSNYDN